MNKFLCENVISWCIVPSRAVLRSTCHKSTVQWVEIIFKEHSYFYTSAFSQYISSIFVYFSKSISQIFCQKLRGSPFTFKTVYAQSLFDKKVVFSPNFSTQPQLTSAECFGKSTTFLSQTKIKQTLF